MKKNSINKNDLDNKDVIKNSFEEDNVYQKNFI